MCSCLSQIVNYTLELPGTKAKLYYNKHVYDPHYSSSDTIIIADRLLKQMPPDVVPHTRILDVACGTGFIGIGVKKLNPQVVVEFSDISREALRICKLNAKRNGFKAKTYQGDLMLGLGSYHMVVANLPTYSAEDMKQALRGPHEAYFASMTNPLELYERLLDQAATKAAVLVCECQSKYQEKFLGLAVNGGWTLIMRTDFGFGFLAP